MAVVLCGDYETAELDAPKWHSRILHATIAREGDVSVSDTDTDEGAFPEAPATDQTWEWWRPFDTPSSWEVDAGEPVTIDAVGLAVHDSADQNATLEIEYSTDGSTWTAVSDSQTMPETNAPILWLFHEIEAQYWRVSVTGGRPRIGVIYIGKALAMKRPVQWRGHTPGVLSRLTEQRANYSERGQRLGKSLIAQGYEASYTTSNLPEGWVREEFDKFIKDAQRYGYFVAWRPTQFPKEVLFGWTDEDIQPENQAGGASSRKMGVSWSMRAHGGYEIGEAPWTA